MLFDRRTLLPVLVAVVLSVPPGLLLAKEAGGPGGHDSSGSNNGVGNDNRGGSDNDTGDDDGEGNDHGEGDDDGGNDNGVGNDDSNDNDSNNDDGDSDNGVGNDDGGNDSVTSDGANESSRSKKREDIEWSQDRVLKERQLGRVISLNTALRIVNTKIHGRVIDVDLMVRRGKPQYRVKVRRIDGLIRTVNVDARTGKVISLLGF